mgnify:CR=1 FL=1|jgi:uncharacterized membrane protein
MLLYFYLILIVVMTSINPYIKKNITKSMNKITFIAVTSIIILFINIFYVYYNNFKLSDLKTITSKDCSYCVLTSILSIAPSLIYLNLIQKENINFLEPLIKPLGLLITALFGIILFKENMCKKQIIGGLIILIGTYIFLNK